MSAIAMERYGAQQPRLGGRVPPTINQAQAGEYFEHFINASSLKNILGYYRTMCELLLLRPNPYPLFYPKLRNSLTNWKAKALWKKLDLRASHKCYAKGKVAANSRVLIIGAGPCGLRAAIEAQLLGAKVVVLEKRDRLSRNNVLHLWPFVIEDLRMLGAKKFFGKFCAGAIDHISIRQLQCILFKVALLLGVEIHTEVSFERLIEPNAEEKTGWRAELNPKNHVVSQYEFDVILGADGKRNTLQGFKRKEFRGKLAIAITANFINKRTEAEARVEEISGVAFIFNQKFFKDLHENTGIDLENIVYYKDDTHYFVMTAKKTSLIEKGVIKQDLADTERLLAPDNVNREALMNYAKEAAGFSTNYQMPDVEFAVNHYGHPDVAMFDFTSMYAAENASKVFERNGYKLLMILVGDSLLEPFWPTGSGCARGFLSSLDAAWAIRSWSLNNQDALEVVAERESIYRLLAQTTPDNLNKDWKSYTLDPSTRYPNLNKGVVLSHQVIGQYDTDNQKNLERIRRNSQDALNAPKKRRRVDNEILINWVKSQVEEHNDIEVTDLTSIFKDGRVLCAIINHYRPDLIDYASLQNNEAVENNQTAIDILDKEIGIPPILTGEEITTTEDSLTLATYLTQVYDTFRCQTPHVKHPKLELPLTKQYEPSFKIIKREAFLAQQKPAHTPAQIPSRPSSRHKRHADAMLPSNKLGSADRKQQRKRRTLERVGTSVVERQKILEEIASNRNDRQSKRRQQRKLQTEQFIKSMQMLQANAKGDHSEPFEDYSLFVYRQTAPNFEDRVKNLEKKFTYVPDHDNKLPSQKPGTDEDFAAKIKNIEQRWYERQTVEKKPKDLMRAIGKIETSDWNIKEIEKKIKENKLGKPINRDKEKVPKWSKEEFVARQTKMEAKKNMDRQDSAEAKFADIDRNIKNLELKLKEGTSRELGTNKVATLTEKLASKVPEEPKPLQKSNSRKEVVLPTPGGSDFCHFCKKRVYLMERISAEGRFFHHTCFKCQYCNSQLRLGSYAFDRDGMYGFKFFCPQHFGMKGEAPSTKVTRKPSQRLQKSPEKRIAGVDLLDRVRTPERIEFSNLSLSRGSSDHEEEMDEDEWTDRNFGASAAEYGSSDEESSNYSDTESDDDEDAYEEALEEPATKEGTMKWAQRLNKRYSQKKNESDESDASSESSDRSSYYENSSEDEESDTATEGEEEIRARELRKQEVRVEPPIIQTDTGTDTEVVSEESSSKSSSEIHNSATEISTDSEFAHDDPTPTREQPRSFPNDMHVNKKRGTSSAIRKVNVTTGFVQKPFNGKTPAKPDIELKLSPLIPVTPSNHPIKKATLAPKLEGYALNRTQSTGGIAAKVSLELKKKYLLGEPLGGNAIQKSGSASTLDTKFKSFHTNITDCQKLLKPASEVNVAVQSVLNNDKQKPLPEENPKKPTLQEEKPHPATPKITTVPQIILTPIKTEKDTLDSLTSSSESTSEPLNTPNFKYEKITTPTPSNGDILSLTSERSVDKSITSEKKSLNQPKTLPDVKNADILPNLHAPSCKLLTSALDDNLSGRSSPEVPTAQLSDTELSDWARDGAVSDDMEDFKLDSEKHSLTKENVKKINLSDHICGKKNIDTKYPDSLNLETIEFMDTGSSTSEDLSDPKKGYVLFKDEDDIAQDSLNPAINEVLEAKNIYIKPQVKNTGYCHVIDKNFGGKVIDLKPSDLEILKQNNSLTEHDEDSLLIIENVQGGSTTEENTYSDSTVKAVKTIDSKIVDNKKNLWSTEFRTKTPKIAEIKPKSIEINSKSIEKTPKSIENTPNTIENKPRSIENKQSEIKNIEKHKITENANVNASKAIENDTTTEINATESKTIENKTTDVKTTENNNTLHKKRLEDKLAQLKKEQALLNLKLTPKQTIDPTNIEFHEHCQRLQSMVEFGNAKDSIDIRKSRRKSKSDSPQKPDLIQEEKSPIQSPSHKNIISNVVKTPDLIYKREIIAKERDVNQKLIQEMVMSKMRDQHKSLERKRRNKTIASPLQSFEIEKPSSPAIIDTKIKKKPDLVLSSTSIPLSKSRTITNVNDLSKNEEKKLLSPLVSPLKDHKRPLSVFSTFSPTLSKTSACSDDFVTPVAPPRSKHDAKVTAERLKTDARARARLLSNEELGLSPEEKFQRLREKSRKKLDVDVEESIKSMVFNTERRNSFLYSNDTLNKKKNDFFRRSKSGDNENNITNNFKYSADNILDSNLNSTKISTEDVKKSRKVFQSDPNLLHTDKKKKEPKKSIKFIKIMDLFSKKSPKGLFSKISPKSKEVSKSCINLDQYFIETYIDEPSKSKSINDISSPYNRNQNNSPPPIPPLPLYYTGPSVKGTDESSDGEWKPEASSCDTIDQIEGALNNSNSSLNGRRSSHKQAKRISRQAQLKRHRMAQEIQRKLEEAEVKTKELEERGVAVEKALRGEDVPKVTPARAGVDDTQGTSRDEADLMQEWFDLMRDRTELRRYERALRIQGQELELEDRHARLQHDLRERLANDCKKTQEDIDVECSIYNEMLDIVSKIDSLKSLLQEDAIRYFKEDRDFEENMLAKGLHLTPVRKTPEK